MSRLDPSLVRSGADVAALLARAFGRDPAGDRGVLQSAAIWEGPHGPRMLRVGEHAPKSPFDFFLLHVARARAEAIVTTGRILRDEPTLRYDLGVVAGLHDALLDYRTSVVGLPERPIVAVLSRGEELDLAHPTFHGWARPMLFVPRSAPRDLDDRAAMNGIPVHRFGTLDLDAAIAALRDDGRRTISIEAGAATTGPRYARGLAFDELVLSRFRGDAIDGRAIGDAFPDQATLERLYGAPRSEVASDEPSGPWSFARYRAP